MKGTSANVYMVRIVVKLEMEYVLDDSVRFVETPLKRL